jgi:hypothetical protein
MRRFESENRALKGSPSVKTQSRRREDRAAPERQAQQKLN